MASKRTIRPSFTQHNLNDVAPTIVPPEKLEDLPPVSDQAKQSAAWQDTLAIKVVQAEDDYGNKIERGVRIHDGKVMYERLVK